MNELWRGAPDQRGKRRSEGTAGSTAPCGSPGCWKPLQAREGPGGRGNPVCLKTGVVRWEGKGEPCWRSRGGHPEAGVQRESLMSRIWSRRRAIGPPKWAETGSQMLLTETVVEMLQKSMAYRFPLKRPRQIWLHFRGLIQSSSSEPEGEELPSAARPAEQERLKGRRAR